MSLQDLTYYVFRVDTGQEKLARDIVLKLGYTPFLPIERRWRARNRHSKRRVTVEYALYPGYLFIGFDGQPNWRELWSIDKFEPMAGIHKPNRYWTRDGRTVIVEERTGDRVITASDRVLKAVLSEDGRPKPADTDQVLRAISESCTYVANTAPSRRKGFGVGDTVEIVEGGFEGFTTEVMEIKRDRFKGMIKLFGVDRAVEFPIDSAQAA